MAQSVLRGGGQVLHCRTELSSRERRMPRSGDECSEARPLEATAALPLMHGRTAAWCGRAAMNHDILDASGPLDPRITTISIDVPRTYSTTFDEAE